LSVFIVKHIRKKRVAKDTKDLNGTKGANVAKGTKDLNVANNLKGYA
jgi:hypothetical protein